MSKRLDNSLIIYCVFFLSTGTIHLIWNFLLVQHNQIWIREIDIFIPVRKMFIKSITHIDNIGIPKHEKHFRLLSSGTKLLITFELKVFRHKEKDTPDFSLCPKPRAHPTQGHGEQAKVNRLLPRQEPNSLTFFKIPKILRARFRCMTSFTSPGQPFHLGFLFWHLWMTHPPRAFFNTCAQVCT